MKESPKVNKQITAKEVRLIDENEQMIGVVSIAKALQMAEEAMLDLVEISPTANPPVCKIMELGKYIYDKQKKVKNAKNAKKLKEIKMKTVIGHHDLEIKINHAIEFLKDRHPVKITVDMVFRQINKEAIADEIIAKIMKTISESVKVSSSVNRVSAKSWQCMLSCI